MCLWLAEVHVGQGPRVDVPAPGGEGAAQEGDRGSLFRIVACVVSARRFEVAAGCACKKETQCFAARHSSDAPRRPTTPTATPRGDRSSALTRYAVVPLLLLALGMRIGMYIQRGRMPARPPQAPREPGAAGPEPAAAPPRPRPPPRQAPDLRDVGVLPQQHLPFAPPVIRRLLPGVRPVPDGHLRNLPAVRALQLRIESDLFVQPLQIGFNAPSGTATLNPELPWNFDSLRRTTPDGAAVLRRDPPRRREVPGRGAARLQRPLGQRGRLPHPHRLHGAVAEHERVLRRVRQRGPPLDQRAPPGCTRIRKRARLHGLPVRRPVRRAAGAGRLGRPGRARPELRERRDRQRLLRHRHDAVRAVPRPDGPRQGGQLRRRLGPLRIDPAQDRAAPGAPFQARATASRATTMPPRAASIVAFETTLLGTAPFSRPQPEGAKELQTTLPFLGFAAVLHRRHRPLSPAGDQSHPVPADRC